MCRYRFYIGFVKHFKSWYKEAQLSENSEKCNKPSGIILGAESLICCVLSRETLISAGFAYCNKAFSKNIFPLTLLRYSQHLCHLHMQNCRKMYRVTSKELNSLPLLASQFPVPRIIPGSRITVFSPSAEARHTSISEKCLDFAYAECSKACLKSDSSSNSPLSLNPSKTAIELIKQNLFTEEPSQA